MGTQEYIDTFADDDGALLNHFGSPQDAFEEMNDELITHGRFADLYEDEQEHFFQYAYRHWMEHITALGVDWINVFVTWESEG